MIVVFSHVCEALGLFPWMRWGLKGSVGHYLDFWSAIFGLALFPAGYLFNALQIDTPSKTSLGSGTRKFPSMVRMIRGNRVFRSPQNKAEDHGPAL